MGPIFALYSWILDNVENRVKYDYQGIILPPSSTHDLQAMAVRGRTPGFLKGFEGDEYL